MDVSASSNKFTVKWGTQDVLGGIYLNNNQSYECNIYSSHFSSLWSADTIVLTGQRYFYIEIKEYNANVNNTITSKSGNISSVTNIDITPVPYSNDAIHKYRCEITGYDSGWVKFITSGPASQTCPSITSNIIEVDVSRKLSAPTISGSGSICSSKVYSISSSDSPTETFTWTVTNGLKIYKNGQYITSYTGTDTSVTVYKPSGSGTGNIKVKASATGYADSDEMVAQVWYGVPSPDEISYYNVGPYYPSQNQICLDFPNDGKALYSNPYAGIVEYEWDALDWTVIQHPNDPHPLVDMQDVLITAPMYGYSVGNTVYFTIRARNGCGWGEWKYPKLELQAVNCGMFMMTISPNPADTYVNVSLTDANLTTEILSGESSKKNKISLKKAKGPKNESIEEYLVQILDKNGTIRKSVRSKSLNLNIDTRDLEPDIYFLHFTINNELYKQQLIIQ